MSDTSSRSSDSRSSQGIHYETLAASASHYLDLQTGGVVPSIHTSTTFARDDRYQLINPAHGYARNDSPAYLPAERVLGDLENAAGCCLFSSGMAAISGVIQALGTTAHVLAPTSFYWGVYAWLKHQCNQSGLRVTTYANDTPAGLLSVLDQLTEKGDLPDLLWIETPSNPFLYVTDIAEAAARAHACGVAVCVDSTAATPVLTRPLELGADLVVHSATKYLNGHGDAVIGAVLSNDDNNALWQTIKQQRGMAGSVPGSLESWLLVRGMRTLFLRVRQSCSNAQQLAEWLEQQAVVAHVHYPGLENHPHHVIAGKQMTQGYGGLLSFELHADKATALKFVGALKLIISATSLGGTETLIEHRASVEPPETGVPDNLLRLAVGVEQIDDLIDDLAQALAHTFG